MLLRGTPNVYTTVGAETLVGAGSWFTQSLRTSSFNPIAFGQVSQQHQRAKINWLLSLSEDQQDTLPLLIDNLAIEAGLHGAKYLLTSCAGDDFLFEIFRRCGYAVCGWERFWIVDPARKPILNADRNGWQRSSPLDTHAIMEFQRKYLPPIIRSISPLANEALPDLVLKESGQIKGYAFIRVFGSKCIIYPVFAPIPEKGLDLFNSLFFLLPDNISIRYIAQTTCHDWLDTILCDFAAPLTNRLELLVKHFAIMEKSPVGILNHATENSHPDPVAPFVHSSKTQDNL